MKQLRYCAEPRIAHVLRVGRPDLIREACNAHDTHILRRLNALLGAAADLLVVMTLLTNVSKILVSRRKAEKQVLPEERDRDSALSHLSNLHKDFAC